MTTFTESYRKYAENFYANTSLAHTDENTISSALGSWINLAFLSIGVEPQLNAEDKAKLEKQLGCSVSDSLTHLKTILNSSPETISLALGFWNTPEYNNLDFNKILRKKVLAVTPNASLGGIPTQDELNRWVDEHSLGIIKEFPVENPESLISLLANVIATKIDWDEPYKVTSEENASWGEKLLTQKRDANLFLGLTEDSKPYAIHWKNDEKDTLSVYSIIGDESLSADTLYKLLAEFESNTNLKNQTISVETAEKFIALEPDFLKFEPQRSSSHVCPTSVELPAWEASQTHDLDNLNVGFESIKELWLKTYDMDVQTKQVAKAAYHKEGFEAAALTFSMVRAAAMFPSREVYSIEAVFNRPYVVAAYSNEKGFENLPLFVSQVRKANSVD